MTKEEIALEAAGPIVEYCRMRLEDASPATVIAVAAWAQSAISAAIDKAAPGIRAEAFRDAAGYIEAQAQAMYGGDER